MRRYWLYLVFVLFFLGSLVGVALLPSRSTLQHVVALPAFGAFFAALLKIFLDLLAHDRALLLLEAQNAFSIGATSHMAIVAFDKHVTFCEEYLGEMYQTLSTLFGKRRRKTR